MASNLTATFFPISPALAVPHKVYTRTSWILPWVEQKHMQCTFATWRLQPGTSQAQLSWRYGEGKRFDEFEWKRVLPDDGSRRYVKIVWQNDFFPINGFNNAVWYGVVFGLGTRADGVRQITERIGAVTTTSNLESGQQAINCVGLEKILSDTIIRTSAWYDLASPAGEVWNIDRGLTFNDYRADGTPGGNKSTFYIDGAPIFTSLPLEDASFWQTREILQYLFKYNSPRDKNGAVQIPFELAPDAFDEIPILNDQPYIPTDGRSLREILNQLLSPQRLLTWRLEVVEPDEFSVGKVQLKVVPLTGNAVVLSDGLIMPNPRRWAVDSDSSPGSAARVLSHAYAVDRVRIRGARGTSTLSLSKADGTLDKGWTSDLETKYNAGATGTAAYLAATTKPEKQQLHAIARSRDELRPVFSRVSIPFEWDGVAKNGEGGGGFDFCPIVTDTKRFKFYPRELFILPTIPLRDGFNYVELGGDGAKKPPLKVSEGPYNALPPLVVMKVPGKNRWCQVEKIGYSAEIEQVPGEPARHWSGRVSVPHMDRSIMITVSGGEQFLIAGTDFVPITGIDKIPGSWDWRQMICTVALQWDAYCEGVYPQFPSVPPVDHVREVILNAPDTFRLDWLVPQTVIGITNEGNLVRSTAGGWINDDRRKLNDRARMAYEYYGQERRAVQWTSGMVNGSIKVGDYVSQMGIYVPSVVNTVVTEIRIDCAGAETPQISYVTDFIPDLNLYLSPNLGSGAPIHGAKTPDFTHSIA